MALLHSVDFGPGQRADALRPADLDPADGPTLVFLGSLGSTTEMWLPQLDHLSNVFRVIALDHRGHGYSPLIPGSPTIADLADDVRQTLATLGVGRYGIVGLSLGGAIAQYLAVYDANVVAAALMSTSPKFGTPESWHERTTEVRANGTASLADAIVARWFSPSWRATHPATTNRYREMIASTPAEGYAACCEALATWDFADELGKISVPVLTIAGEDDPSTTPTTLASIAKAVSGPVTSTVLSPAAHVSTIERPEEVNAALRAHFEKHLVSAL